eukprot:GILI01012724.1.p1 GENE.GILI01012724.1~~GILI01012724.1.p1  ORF type:complete len:164 (-),score=32.74 GILI01012724.1:43-534(-)
MNGSPPVSPRSRFPAPGDLNNFTSWAQRKGFRYMYVFFVFLIYLVARIFVSDNGTSWSATLVIHNLITFVFFHWIKGTPEASMLMEDKVVTQTFWEQLEDGYLGTPTRRFLAFVPIVLFTIALMASHPATLTTLVVNTGTTLAVLLPKTEFLFGVRIFGINAD